MGGSSDDDFDYDGCDYAGIGPAEDASDDEFEENPVLEEESSTGGVDEDPDGVIDLSCGEGKLEKFVVVEGTGPFPPVDAAVYGKSPESAVSV